MSDHKPPIVADEALSDLHARIRNTRLTANPWGADASKGLLTSELQSLLTYWADGYDWRANEARIQSLPWEVIGSGEGALRMIHQRSTNPSAPVIVLLHGWPDSVLRFERILPLLTDFHVVVPALPGFPFSTPLAEAVSARRIAEIVAGALMELAYEHYTVSGADVGSAIGEILAAEHPDRVDGLHLANVAAAHVATADPGTLPEDAVAYLSELNAWRRTEAGFIAEQSTRPNTLIAALGDSPAGLLAWIGEKLQGWSDATGGSAFSRDALLTWISAYWFTGTIGTSFSTYVMPAQLPEFIETPVILSAFAHDIIPAPRSYGEAFLNVHDFVEHPNGGHFAAWEQPKLFAEDLQATTTLRARAT